MLGAVDEIRRGLVGQSVAKLGADAATVNRFADRAGMNAAARSVMVETSPAVAASLGVNAQNVPITAFLSALAADLGGFALLIGEIKKLGEELKAIRTPAPATGQGSQGKA